jgi:hypothetical protein
MIAPRPFLNVSGSHDACFPEVASIEECCALTSQAWDFLGAPERFRNRIFDGPHDHFETELIYGWMRRWVGGES